MTSLKRHFFIISFVFITMVVFTALCYADSIASINICGSHYTDTVPDIKKCIFVLTPCNEAPMPEDTENGSKRISVKPGSKFEFGEISFTKPGFYEYTVSRETTESEELIIDRSVYMVSVEVFSDGTTAVLYHKEGEEGKPDGIKYIDLRQVHNYDENAEYLNTQVKTGDVVHYTEYIILLSAALISLIICRFILFKKGADQADPAMSDHTKN